MRARILAAQSDCQSDWSHGRCRYKLRLTNALYRYHFQSNAFQVHACLPAPPACHVVLTYCVARSC